MKLTIETVAYHRNGVCGAPFHAILFRDPDEGRMLGVVFDSPHHLAVFHLDKLALGNVAFGVNSWRGDRYEPALRAAVREHGGDADEPTVAPLDVHAILAERRQVTVVWNSEDVQAVRPDLSDDESWAVLRACRRVHDCEVGFNWLLIEVVADDLFPEPGDADAGDRP